MKKKAIVVTVYNSHNSGSFLQAFAMNEVLKKEGLDVSFLERKNVGSHSVKMLLKNVIRDLLKFRFKKAISSVSIWGVFENLPKSCFDIQKKGSTYYEQTDYVILGSDTIWNFDNKYFSNNARLYLGACFEGKKVVSYAASAANTSLETFRRVTSETGLDHLASIMVRDFYTKQLVKDACGKEAVIVTDPSLLLNAEDYSSLVRKVEIKQPYLLIYYFGEISTDMKKNVKLYAKNKNLKIVSLPYNRSWCDLSRNQSPYNMVSYFQQAECVITNTFHGCAFSLIFEKPFAVHNENKKKVTNLLEMYGEQEIGRASCRERV